MSRALNIQSTFCIFFFALGFSFLFGTLVSTKAQESPSKSGANKLSLRLRTQVPTKLDLSKHQFAIKNEDWLPEETAIIVCDFWDYHHCFNAVQRMKEFGPTLNRVIQKSRELGVTIIHSPSDCMEAYETHPARKRARKLPSYKPPEFAASWCSQIPGEEASNYPIDQSDGGEDDDPEKHRVWAEFLKSIGRNPNLPWKKQNDMVPIDGKLDYITDRGDEAWNILKHKGIKNVVLVGVHTNMCVLGRPFGLRQMKRFGFNVALMRDMTDSMYNPAKWPFVSHYSGHDRVIAHVEKFVCPTISSDQIIGGNEFAFKSDPRKHLVVVIGEQEYKTEQTLPAFVESELSDFRVSFILANPEDRNDFPDYEKINSADLLLISVRRRVLKPEQLSVIRELEKAGKPIVGIRTASHAFSLRKSAPPKGYRDWKSFDSDVFGGSYTNHYGNKLKSSVTYTPLALKHPITTGLARAVESGDRKNEQDVKTFGQNGSLYKTAPLAEGTRVLLNGSVLGHPPEPSAWTYTRVNGGKSFYTSLGHPLDFKNPEFVLLLRNAIYWAAGEAIPPKSKPISKRKYWRLIDAIRIPQPKNLLKFELESKEKLDGLCTFVAFRKVVSFPKSWNKNSDVRLRAGKEVSDVWLNGKKLAVEHDEGGRYFVFDSKSVEFGEANWLTIGAKFLESSKSTNEIEVVFHVGDVRKTLAGDWEWISASKGFADASRVFLPAKFGGGPRIYQEF